MTNQTQTVGKTTTAGKTANNNANRVVLNLTLEDAKKLNECASIGRLMGSEEFKPLWENLHQRLTKTIDKKTPAEKQEESQ